MSDDTLTPVDNVIIAVLCIILFVLCIVLICLVVAPSPNETLHKYYQRHGYDITLEEVEAGIRLCNCQQPSGKGK